MYDFVFENKILFQFTFECESKIFPVFRFSFLYQKLELAIYLYAMYVCTLVQYTFVRKKNNSYTCKVVDVSIFNKYMFISFPPYQKKRRQIISQRKLLN